MLKFEATWMYHCVEVRYHEVRNAHPYWNDGFEETESHYDDKYKKREYGPRVREVLADPVPLSTPADNFGTAAETQVTPQVEQVLSSTPADKLGTAAEGWFPSGPLPGTASSSIFSFMAKFIGSLS